MKGDENSFQIRYHSNNLNRNNNNLIRRIFLNKLEIKLKDSVKV